MSEEVLMSKNIGEPAASICCGVIEAIESPCTRVLNCEGNWNHSSLLIHLDNIALSLTAASAVTCSANKQAITLAFASLSLFLAAALVIAMRNTSCN